MKDQQKNQVTKIFFRDKPFMLLQIIYYNNGKVYSAMISKKIDCSYAYIVKLLKIMNRLGITYFEGSRHKKMVCLSNKGKRLFKYLEEASAVK